MRNEPHRLFSSYWQKTLMSCFFLLLFVVEALSFWGALGWRPHFLLMAVYYGALYQPSRVSVLSLVVVGLLRDGYFGFPLGQGSLIYVLTFVIIERQRLLWQERSILWDWLGFAVVASLAAGLHWLIVSWFQKSYPPFMPQLVNALLTSLFYPGGAWVIQHVSRIINRLQAS
jgi:rod shape-determining protein MreD